MFEQFSKMIVLDVNLCINAFCLCIYCLAPKTATFWMHDTIDTIKA